MNFGNIVFLIGEFAIGWVIGWSVSFAVSKIKSQKRKYPHNGLSFAGSPQTK